jgi:transcriptional regulator with XRE-family HTH domain
MPLTRTPDRALQLLTGKAIRTLRERAGLKQADIAGALEFSTQAYQKYESGERKFTDEKLPVILEAIGATVTDLEAERARLLGRDPPEGHGGEQRADPFTVSVSRERPAEPERAWPSRQIDLRHLLRPSTGAVEMGGDEMAPWAEPGETLLFDRDRYPKRGFGCVVELKSGALMPRLYEGSDGSSLFVKVLRPEPRVTPVPMTDVRGVYAVTLRGD